MLREILPKGFFFWTGAAVVALILPFVYGTDYFISVCVLFGLYASINLMWMLVIGTAGIYSFATIAIVGAAAYLVTYTGGGSPSGYDLGKEGLPLPVMLLVATAAGAALGAIIAAPGIRLSGVYFALFTIGLVELGRVFVLQRIELGQNQGLYGADQFVSTNRIGTETGRYINYFVALALVAFSLVVYRLVDGGRLGLLLRTARESEAVARALGVDVNRARLAVFIISSAMLGLIGGFYVGFYGGTSPQIFDFDTLLLLLAMIVVGGLGSAKGAVIGTALLLFIDQRWIESGATRFIAIGIIMLAITLATPRGLAGLPGQLAGYWRRLGGEDEPDEVPAAAGGGERPAGASPTGASS